MKKQILPLALAALSFSTVKAQQWNGSTTAEDTIQRNGNVIIGNSTNDESSLSIKGNTARLKIGVKTGTATSYLEMLNWNVISVSGSGNLLLSSSKGTLLVSNGERTVFGEHLNWGGIRGGLKSKFAFNGEVGATRLFVSPAGVAMDSPLMPKSFLFSVNGSAHIGNKLVIGDTLLNTSGNYRLFVKDGILTEKLKVAVANESDWADYVFAPSYKLKSLTEVETYVKTNKHLPGLPSAEEVKNEGIDVARMDAKLLEKIEELTLYMIQLQKENAEVKKELSNIKKAQSSK